MSESDLAEHAEPVRGAVASTGARAIVASLPRRVGRFVVDWLPILIALFAYDEIHNRLGPLLPVPHTLPQIRADEVLFGAPVLAVRLQRAFYSAAHPHVWDFAALAIYTSHFFVAPAIALALWFRARGRYLRFMWSFVGMTTLGYATYVLYPAVPPWLASQHGALEQTHRIVRELWEQLGRSDVAATFSGTNVLANDVAAIPSLHGAYPLMIALFFWPTSRPSIRIAMALYVGLMALTLVYMAEHYVVDILIGWAYAIATAAVMRRVWTVGSSRL